VIASPSFNIQETVKQEIDGIMMTEREHLPGYQERDREIVDYQMYSLGKTNLWFRGPAVENLKPGQYFACIGAAQTFGCFCEQPFPTLLQEELGLPALNLGYGGAGPYFFIKHQELLPYINQAKFVIIQVMSGRSESNSLFDSGGLELLTRRSDGIQLGADAAYKRVLEGNDLWQNVPFGQRYVRGLIKILEKGKVKKLVAETRNNWIKNYQILLSQITAPKVLFWFSKREPEYQEKYNSLGALFNEFPQLVTQDMINQIKDWSNEYVECISNRGSPQLLISRFTGKPAEVDPELDRKELGGKIWTHNVYYPSPEMHGDAVRKLAPVCQKYLHLKTLALPDLQRRKSH
jgi:hypothetical protein